MEIEMGKDIEIKEEIEMMETRIGIATERERVLHPVLPHEKHTHTHIGKMNNARLSDRFKL